MLRSPVVYQLVNMQNTLILSCSAVQGFVCTCGSMVVGSKDFIDRARKIGNAWRWYASGWILAAAGIIALTKMVDRLQEDHDNANCWQ